ncbi:MAG: zf-HC2 domain-containing protein [Thermodesulfobacteriota bacterium]
MKKLTCTNIEELVIRDLDAGLDDRERVALDAHVLECATCRELRQEMARLIAALKTDAPEDPGEEYWRRYDLSLDAKLREKEMNRNAWGLRWKLAAAAICVVLAVFAAWEYSMRLDQDGQTLPSRTLALVEDLNELYGPVEEDRYASADVQAVAIISADSRIAFLNDGLMIWFEAEDEADNLLL